MAAIGVAWGVLAIVALILVNAFYVAGEFALVAVDRNDLEPLADEGSRRAQRTLRAVRTLSFQLSGAQLGITVSSLLLGIVTEPVFKEILAPVWDAENYAGVAAVVGLVIVTIVQMVFGELTPKTYAISNPLPTALWIGPAMRWVNLVLKPLIAFFNGAANATLRLLGIEPREELRRGRSLEELELVVRSSAEGGELGDAEYALLVKSFDFADKTASDAYVPRTAIVALRADALLSEMVTASVETGHSRFPVYAGDLDEIVGIVHVKDAFQVALGDRDNTLAATIAHPAYAVPETVGLPSLLVDLRDRGQQMAVVVDEYGGTAGIITMEDVLEEIVGDIEDEYDTGELHLPEQPETAFGPSRWLVEGMLHRDELAERCGFELPEGDWDTLAGFLLDRFAHIPEPGEMVECDGWTFTVFELDRRRIANVEVKAPVKSSEEDVAEGKGGTVEAERGSESP